MKRICALLAVWLFAPLIAQAAITRADSQLTNSSGAITVTANSAASIGDLIVISEQSGGAETGVTDQLGNVYHLLSADATAFSGYTEYINVLYSVVTVAGTPTVTSSSGQVNGRMAYLRYTGFVHTPTVVTGDTNFNQGTTPHSVGFSAAFTGTVANEYAFGAMVNQSGGGTTGTNAQWAAVGSSAYLNTYDTVADGPLASGTNFSLTGTVGADSAYGLRIYGFYDNPGTSTCIHNFYSAAGAFTQPNGTSGSYWNVATGAFTTPNCSTGSFWRQDGAGAAN